MQSNINCFDSMELCWVRLKARYYYIQIKRTEKLCKIFSIFIIILFVWNSPIYIPSSTSPLNSRRYRKQKKQIKKGQKIEAINTIHTHTRVNKQAGRRLCVPITSTYCMSRSYLKLASLWGGTTTSEVQHLCNGRNMASVCVENPFDVIVVVENIFVDHIDCSAIVIRCTSFMCFVAVNTMPAASGHLNLTWYSSAQPNEFSKTQQFSGFKWYQIASCMVYGRMVKELISSQLFILSRISVVPKMSPKSWQATC